MRNFLYILLIFTLVASCLNKHLDETKLDSDDYEKREARLDILTREIKVFSKIVDTEFELFNVNGFHNSRTSVPGASAWDYKIAIKEGSNLVRIGSLIFGERN